MVLSCFRILLIFKYLRQKIDVFSSKLRVNSCLLFDVKDSYQTIKIRKAAAYRLTIFFS
jgi:hypothetical protein